MKRSKVGNMGATVQRVAEELLSCSLLFEEKPDKSEGKSHAQK